MDSTLERQFFDMDLLNGGDMEKADRFWWLVISEKTKPFYCPSGATFSTKSKYLRQTTQSTCSLKSSCSWSMSNGCSASIFSYVMNEQFRGSCDIHDLCYHKHGRYKHTCDNEFYENMKNQCRSENYPLGCWTLAWIAYTVVKSNAKAMSGYELGQNKGKTQRWKLGINKKLENKEGVWKSDDLWIFKTKGYDMIYIENTSKAKVLGAKYDGKVFQEFLVEGKADQLWKKGEPDAEGYFTLQNSVLLYVPQA